MTKQTWYLRIILEQNPDIDIKIATFCNPPKNKSAT